MSKRLVPIPPGAQQILTLDNWLKWEPMIATVIRSFPNTIVFKPRTLKPSTFRLYFRTFCCAFIHEDCPWRATFSREQVWDMYENGLTIKVDFAKNEVRCGLKQDLHTRTFQEIAINAAAINTFDEEIIRAIALLKHHDILTQPVTFTRLDQTLLDQLQVQYDNLIIDGDATTTTFF